MCVAVSVSSVCTDSRLFNYISIIVFLMKLTGQLSTLGFITTLQCLTMKHPTPPHPTQGCMLSPLLFTLCTHHVCNVRHGENSVVNFGYTAILAYFYDLLFIHSFISFLFWEYIKGLELAFRFPTLCCKMINKFTLLPCKKKKKKKYTW